MIPKFRAYVKNGYRYLKIGSDRWVFIFNDYDDEVKVHDHMVVLITNKENIVLSTGLKDKNDVEIYEGDIVRIKSSDGVDYKAVIMFKDGGFCAVDGIEDNYSTRRYQLHKGDFELEVISNIYETSHLLEDE